ncbi:hypothetical protein PAMP_005596 [Pampus punctatissimus]
MSPSNPRDNEGECKIIEMLRHLLDPALHYHKVHSEEAPLSCSSWESGRRPLLSFAGISRAQINLGDMVEDGYGEDEVSQGPQATVTPQSDLKRDFCRMANGKNPWRFKA